MSKSLPTTITGNSPIKYDIENVQRLLKKRQNKANEIIQNYRYNLPPYENKVLTYIVSHINWEDKDVQGIDINIHEFHALCDLAPPSGGKDYAYFGQAINYLMNAKIARLKDEVSEDEQKLEVFSWLKNDFEINIKNADFTVHLHDKVKNYFLDMQSIYARTNNGYTSCYVSAIMRMKGLYSGRLYELLKSYLNMGYWTVNLDDLRALITPKENPVTRQDNKKGKDTRKGGKKSPNLLESYPEFKDFNKYVLKPAIAEINEKSDIFIDPDKDIQKIRNSERKVVALRFTISAKSAAEIRKIEEATRRDVERAKIIRDTSIAEDIKKQMLLQLDVMDPEEFTPSVVLNETLLPEELRKRHSLQKAINLRLGKDFQSEFTDEEAANYSDVFESFIDVIWDDIKAYGNECLGVKIVNEIIHNMMLRDLVRNIIYKYGHESFWQYVERNGKTIKYRNKYRKAAIQNDLADWENFVAQTFDAKVYSDEHRAVPQEDDVIINAINDVPVFRDFNQE